jgi:hypothetical protein
MKHDKYNQERLRKRLKKLTLKEFIENVMLDCEKKGSYTQKDLALLDRGIF